ncbi:DUF5362 family protein [Sutcliffiella halmapala]|uniref:DUF5362 family protein n=1 Tax=Sutcliffiella halmapala TaxID=79882 RepID=UPI000995AA54|nr:DUF5362 family protein [Sutcliffiella halmapala]
MNEAREKYVSLDVEKKKSALGSVGKFLGLIVGGTGILIGAILCITIIGILFGLPLMIASMGLILSVQGYQMISCPTCNKKQKVLQSKENLDCVKCRQFTVINWK